MKRFAIALLLFPCAAVAADKAGPPVVEFKDRIESVREKEGKVTFDLHAAIYRIDPKSAQGRALLDRAKALATQGSRVQVRAEADTLRILSIDSASDAKPAPK